MITSIKHWSIPPTEINAGNGLIKSFKFDTREQFDEYLLAIIHITNKFTDNQVSVEVAEHTQDLFADIHVYSSELFLINDVCANIDKLYYRIMCRKEHKRFSWLPKE
jgi:hypothetical protein